MSRRFNKYGVSLSRMRALFGSRDETALQHLRHDIAARNQFRRPEEQEAILEVVNRAVMSGVPFRDLPVETWVHAVAAETLAGHGQEWLMNYSALLEDASLLEEGLWRRYRKVASPEARAFLHGLVEGIPLFGSSPTLDGCVYGVVSLERLRVFQPACRDFAETIAFRVGRNKAATDFDQNVAEFATEFSAWLEELITAERDLFFSFG